jgi:hypothetical protein
MVLVATSLFESSGSPEVLKGRVCNGFRYQLLIGFHEHLKVFDTDDIHGR